MSKKRINIHDVKQALLDERFRDSLPESLKEDVQKFLKNPGCGCNNPIYINVMRKAKAQIEEYFPTRNTPTEEDFKRETESLARNNWQVINCKANELQEELKKLGSGRKQIDVARWEDEITVIVNHLDGIY